MSSFSPHLVRFYCSRLKGPRRKVVRNIGGSILALTSICRFYFSVFHTSQSTEPAFNERKLAHVDCFVFSGSEFFSVSCTTKGLFASHTCSDQVWKFNSTPSFVASNVVAATCVEDADRFWSAKFTGKFPPNCAHLTVTCEYCDNWFYELCPPSQGGRYVTFEMLEGFSNQLLSLVNTIYIAKTFDFILVLPEHVGSRHRMVVTEQTTVIANQVPFHMLYDINMLKTELRNLNVRTAMLSDLHNHHYRVSVLVHRRESLHKLLHDLSDLQQYSDVLINVGHMFLRIVPSDCSTHSLLSAITHMVVSSFSAELKSLANRIVSQLRPYNSVHLRIEEDAQHVWKNSDRLSRTWPSVLEVHGFKPMKSLYAACGSGCDTKQSVFKFLYKKEDLLESRQNISIELDVIAAVDLMVIVESDNFAGSSYSAFSHLAVTLRRYLYPKRVNLDIFATVVGPFEKNVNVMFGSSTPNPRCTPAIVHELVHYSELAFPNEVLFVLKSTVLKLGLTNFPFYGVVSALLWRASGHEAVMTNLIRLLNGSLRPLDSFENDVIAVSSDPAIRKLLTPSLCPLKTRIDLCTQFKVLFITHTTRYEGAPIAMARLASIYRKTLNFQVSVLVNPTQRGTLEHELAGIGIEIISSYSFDPTRYDVIMINTIVGWFKQPLKPWLHKAILWVHESMREYLFTTYPHVPAVMEGAEALVFVTNRSKAVYDDVVSRRRNPSTSFVIPNALQNDLLFAAQRHTIRKHIRSTVFGVGESGLVFMQSGTVNQERNQLTFVLAAIRLIQDFPRMSNILRFVVLGFSGQQEYRSYEDQIRRATSLNFQKNFILIDKAPYTESLQYLAAADVYTSLSMSESFGFTLLEAMTYGMPICVAKRDGVPDVVYEQAIDVEPRSPDSVCSCFKYFLEHKHRIIHSQSSWEHSKKFAVEHHLFQHLEVLKAVVHF